MINVGIIVTSYWSYGELLIAIEFAKNIRAHGFNPYFFAPHTHKKILEENGLAYATLFQGNGKINRILFQDYENRCHPQFIILSDFLNYYFCERHYGLQVEDLKIFSGQIGTIDIFEWEIEKRKMDTYGFAAKTVAEVNINEFGFKLVPCPIANPILGQTQSVDKMYYPLFEEKINYCEEDKVRLRKELNLPLAQPILLMTAATWQQTYKQYDHVVDFVATTNKVLKMILEKVAKDALIILVGAKDFFGEKETPQNVMLMDKMPTSEFERYAIASDLFVARNITSTTMARLAISGIPCVSISSSVGFTDVGKYKYKFDVLPEVKELLDKLHICYPYRMFPVGWHMFLKPVVRDNPYMNIVTELELFDVENCVQKIRALLYDANIQKAYKQQVVTYNDLLLKLKRPYELLNALT